MAKSQKTPVPQPVKTVPVTRPDIAAGAKKPANPITLLTIVLGIIAFLVYANTLGLDYALDDFTVIKNNSIVTKGISAIPEILTTPYRHGWFLTHNDLYRPLSLVMFAIEWQIGGGSPVAGHFMNVVVYMGCVMLLFRFLNAFFDGKRLAAVTVAALIFALHPIHTEVVANIKSRDELLSFFFGFLSLNLYLQYARTGKIQQLILGSACYFLSYLSKETVIAFLFVIPFIFLLYHNEDKKRSIAITVSAVAITAVYLAVRFGVLRAYDANTSSEVSFMDNFLVEPPNAASRLATELLILGMYIKLMVIPAPLICDYCYNSIPFTTFGNIWVILSLLAYVGLTVFAIIRLIKNRKDPYAFAIMFYMATIALFSNIVFIIGAAMAERFAFFASAGFCLAVGLVVEQFLLKKKQTGYDDVKNGKSLGVMAVAGGIFAFMVHTRNGEWKDNYTLFKTDVVKNENNSRLNYYLGTEMVSTLAKGEGNPAVKKQYIVDAIPYLHRSLAVYPKYVDANASMGDAYFQLNILDSAEYYDKRSLAQNPNFTVAINNLAGVYFMQNMFDKALEVCRKAIVLNPSYVNAYSNMGLCYMRMHMYDSSLQSLYKAISLDPGFKSAYENMALTYKAIGNQDSVRKYEAMAKQ